MDVYRKIWFCGLTKIKDQIFLNLDCHKKFKIEGKTNLTQIYEKNVASPKFLHVIQIIKIFGNITLPPGKIKDGLNDVNFSIREKFSHPIYSSFHILNTISEN